MARTASSHGAPRNIGSASSEASLDPVASPAATKPGAGRRNLQALTGLRFFAAAYVVVFHFGRSMATNFSEPVRNIVGSGYAGVTLFYLLSGFILSYNYLGGGAAPIDKRAFFEARFARVYPVYVLGLLLSIPLVLQKLTDLGILPGHPVRAMATAALSVVLLQSWWPTTATLWNPPGWSLSNEAFFYLLFPVVAVALMRLRRGMLLPVALALWIATLLAPTLYLLINPDGIGAGSPVSEAFWISAVKYHPLVRLPEFLLGVLLGIHFLRRSQPTDARLRRDGWLSVVAAGLLLLLFGASSYVPYPLMHNGLAAPLFACLILTLASDTGPLAWLLKRPLVIILGEASYSLYILHFPLVDWAQRGAAAVGMGHSGATITAIIFLLVVPVLVLKFYEQPARRALRRHSKLSPVSNR